MHILLLNQFYPPDPAPTGQFLHDLARDLVARGHRVTVICSSRAYLGATRYARRETRNGVTVHRVRCSHLGRRSMLGRTLDYASFFFAAAGAAACLRPRPDFTLALTTPPYVGLIARHLASGSTARHGHWLMDLYPDVVEAHGMLRPDTLANRCLRALTRHQLRGSALTIVLGEEMIPRAAAYGTEAIAIPLWGPASLRPWPATEPRPLRAQRGWREDELVLMYSGNMGLGHRLGEFLSAAEALKDNARVRWVFAGGGQRRTEVEAFCRRVPDARVELGGGVAPDRLRDHLCSADVHLASLAPDWQGCMIPSKLQGIFAVGRPVIFVGGPDNSAARWITESGGGWVVAPDDVPALLRAVTEAADPATCARRGAAAAAYARAHFDHHANCARLAMGIEAAAQSAPPAS